MGKQVNYFMIKEDFKGFFENMMQLDVLIYDSKEKRFIKNGDYPDKSYYPFYLIDPKVYPEEETLPELQKWNSGEFDYIRNALEVSILLLDEIELSCDTSRIWLDVKHYREEEDYLNYCYKHIHKYIKKHATWDKSMQDYIFESMIKKYPDLGTIIKGYHLFKRK